MHRLLWLALLCACGSDPEAAPSVESSAVGVFTERKPTQCELLDDYASATPVHDAGTSVGDLVVDVIVEQECTRWEMSLCWAPRDMDRGYGVAQLWLVADASEVASVVERKQQKIRSSGYMRPLCQEDSHATLRFDLDEVAESPLFGSELVRLDLAGFDRELWIRRPDGASVASPLAAESPSGVSAAPPRP